MKFETAVITVCFIIKWSEGYVANVNTRLTTEQPTSENKVDLKMNFKYLVGTSNHENSISTTRSSYDESKIIFPSHDPYERTYNQLVSTDMPVRMGEQAEKRLSPSDSIESKPAKYEQLSRYSFGNLNERDDDHDRPIWRS